MSTGERPPSTGDRVAGVLALAVLALLALVLAFWALLGGSMAAGNCSECDDSLASLSVWVTTAWPLVAVAGVMGWLGLRWVRGSRIWWVPLAGVPLVVGGWWVLLQWVNAATA